MTDSADLQLRRQAELEALDASQAAEFGTDDFQVPILKVAQALTTEVQAGDAEEGEFINTGTGEVLGDNIQFIIAYYQRGRSARDQRTGDYYTTFSDTIPQAWSEHTKIDPEWVGTPFSEFPDAEEQYKVRVNNGEIEWESGPLVSTTHNYTGLIVLEAEEGSDEPPELLPGRLTLKRSDMRGVKKIRQIKDWKLRNKRFWDAIFELSTKAKPNANGSTSYIVVPALGRETTQLERDVATDLALATAGGRVVESGDPDGPKAAPDAQGGLAV